MPNTSMPQRAAAGTTRCACTTAFGSPVVPDEYSQNAGISGERVSAAAAAAASTRVRHAPRDTAFATAAGAGRPILAEPCRVPSLRGERIPVARSEPGIQRHGDRARMDRAEKRRNPDRIVGQRDHDPLAGIHPHRPPGAGGPRDRPPQFRVGRRHAVGDQRRRVVAPALEERRRQVHRVGASATLSGPWRTGLHRRTHAPATRICHAARRCRGHPRLRNSRSATDHRRVGGRRRAQLVQQPPRALDGAPVALLPRAEQLVPRRRCRRRRSAPRRRSCAAVPTDRRASRSRASICQCSSPGSARDPLAQPRQPEPRRQARNRSRRPARPAASWRRRPRRCRASRTACRASRRAPPASSRHALARRSRATAASIARALGRVEQRRQARGQRLDARREVRDRRRHVLGQPPRAQEPRRAALELRGSCRSASPTARASSTLLSSASIAFQSGDEAEDLAAQQVGAHDLVRPRAGGLHQPVHERAADAVEHAVGDVRRDDLALQRMPRHVRGVALAAARAGK